MIDVQQIELLILRDGFIKRNGNIFRRLQLKIALATPSANDEKYIVTNNAAI